MRNKNKVTELKTVLQRVRESNALHTVWVKSVNLKIKIGICAKCVLILL